MLGLVTYANDLFVGKAPLGARRSSGWTRFRRSIIAETPQCSVCGSTQKLEVHHIIPFHIDPERELDPTNIVVLCESGKLGVICHRFFGHLGDYKLYNKDVLMDALIWQTKLLRVRE